jgi:hypothetical protein
MGSPQGVGVFSRWLICAGRLGQLELVQSLLYKLVGSDILAPQGSECYGSKKIGVRGFYPNIRFLISHYVPS